MYLAEYEKIVKKTSPLKFNVIAVKTSMIRDFVCHLKPYFLKTVKSDTKDRFLVSTYRVFRYIHNSDVLECSVSASMPIFSKFRLQKQSQNITLAAPCAYQGKLPIKPAKLKDTIALAEQYVPRNDMWYYEELKSTSGEPSGDSPDSVTEDEDNDV